MRYVGGVVLEGGDVALAHVLVRIAVAHLQRVNGTAPPDALALRDQLAAFARKPSALADGRCEPAKPAGAALVSVSVPQMTVRDAAALLTLTEQRVRALCRSGALVAERSAAGHWQVDADSAQALAGRRKGI